jgi:hypothetical protein
LRLKIFGGPQNGQTVYFNPNDGERITIGRAKSNRIEIEDLVLSKLQCLVEFNQDKEAWVITDGNGVGKKSMNGTWLYLNEDFRIQSDMVFKTNSTLFMAQIGEFGG